MFIVAAGPGSAAGPVGTIIGGLIDLGVIFGGLFGLFGGGSSQPKFSTTVFDVSPVQTVTNAAVADSAPALITHGTSDNGPSTGAWPYTSRLQKGGALISDMRQLVRAWSDAPAQEGRAPGPVAGPTDRLVTP